MTHEVMSSATALIINLSRKNISPPSSLSRRLPHCRLRLLKPVRHAHLAVHRRRGGEMLVRLLTLARAPVELAEAEVAVGDEGAHAEVAGERQRLAVVPLSRLSVERMLMRCCGGEGMKRLRFSTSRLDLTGDINCPLGAFARLSQATSSQVALAEPCEVPEMANLVAGGFRFYDSLLEQGERLV